MEEHLKSYIDEVDNFERSVPTIIRIPVVVHVLHNGEPIGTGLNVNMAQIESQIDVLNEDFRRLNNDAVNTPVLFQTIAADSGIEFYLTCVDPNGNPTNGVIRRQTGLDFFSQPLNNIKYNNLGGSDAWPTDRYLNVWVGGNIRDLTGNDLLGYAQFPDQYVSSPNTDGVVIMTTAFGRVGNVIAPFNLGRTGSHEVAHWLNLRHIWGDGVGCDLPTASPTCSCHLDDLVLDTPNQGRANAGCPDHPSSTCESEDMFMNYMDYSDDACMNIFTQGQRNRMRAVLSPGGVRHSFITSPLGMSVTGPDRICTTNTNFTLQNVPAGQTVTWAVSPIHLFPTTGRSGTGATAALRAMHSSSSGLATLTYTIDTGCGEFQVQRQLWVGVPDTGMQVDANYYPICMNEYTYINAFYDPFNANPPGNKEADITSFIWEQPSGVSCFTAGTKNEVLACWFNTPDNYIVRVRAVNSCGQGALKTVFFNVDSWGCSYFSVGISPNPANGRVTIELTETPLDDAAKSVLQSENKGSREYQEYSFNTPPHRIRVFDIVGAERLCVENVPEGNRHELDISHLTPGVYVVHLEHRNGTVVRQLRVD